MPKPGREDGFTLVELAIVCVIIGILACIAIPNYSRTKARSSRASCVSNQRNLFVAGTLYAADHGVVNEVPNSQDLFDAGYIPAGLTHCPGSPTPGHDQYEITIAGGKVTALRCLVEPGEHLWSP